MKKGLKFAFLFTGIIAIFSLSFHFLHNFQNTKPEKFSTTPPVHEAPVLEPTPAYFYAKIDRYKFINKYEKKSAAIMAKEQHLKQTEWKNIYKKIIDSVYQYKSEIYIKQEADIMSWISTALVNNIFVRLAVDDFDVTHKGHTLHIKYRYPTKQEHEKKMAEAEKIILDLINKYENSDCNELEKTIGIYSYWARNIKYDYKSIKKGKIPSIEDVLFHNKGICQNYSLAIAYTLNQMNIEIYDVSGEVNGGPHAWNLVKIYGLYYHIDATFESTGDTMGNGLTYFGLSDKDMIRENRIVDSPYSNPHFKASSKKLKKLRGAFSYKLNNHILTLYDAGKQITGTIDTSN